MDQSDNAKLVKLLRELTDLAELYQQEYSDQTELHLHPADIPSDEIYYELSINFDLLDDAAQDQLEEIVEDYYVTHFTPMKKQVRQYYGKVIPANQIDKVSTILGINPIDTRSTEELYDKFVKLYDQLFSELYRIFKAGELVEYYFGKIYYMRKMDARQSFAIDEEEINVYMMDYSSDEDVPDIYQLPLDKTLVRAIKFGCYPVEQIRFYTTV